MQSERHATGALPSETIAMDAQDKHDVDFVEEVLKTENHAMAIMPDSLRELSPEDRKTLERKLTRKVDLIVL